MILKVTRETIAKSVADRFEKQYKGKGNIYPNHFGKIEKLKALGKTPNPDDIEKIIGNDSWTRVPSCNNCDEERDRDFDVVYSLTGGGEYESFIICPDCINFLYGLTKK